MTPEEQQAATHAPAPSALEESTANAADVISPGDMKLLHDRRKRYAQLATDPRVEPHDRELAKQRYTLTAKIIASQGSPIVTDKPDETPFGTYIRNQSDAAFFGLPTRAVLKRAGDEFASPAEIEAIKHQNNVNDATNPIAAGGGQFVGGQLGLPALTFHGAGRAANALLGTPTSALGNLAMGPIKGAATGYAGNVGNSTIEDVTGGEPGWERTMRALKNPLPLVVGGGLGALGGSAAGIKASKTQLGKDIRTVEDTAGGSVNPVTGAGGGYYKSDVLKGMHSASDIGEVSRKAAQSVLGKLNAKFAAAGAKYGADVADAHASGAMARRIDVMPLLQEAQNSLRGERLTAGTRSLIQREVIDRLEAKLATGMSLQDFNEFKGKLSDLADEGKPAPHDIQQREFGGMAEKARQMRSNTAMADIDKDYAKAMDQLENAHEAMGFRPGTTHTEPGLRGNEHKAANFINRIGQDTITSGKQVEDINRVLADHPELAQELHATEMLRAKQRLALGLPHGGLEHRALGLLGHNVEPTLGAVYRGLRVAPTLMPAIPFVQRTWDDREGEVK